MTEVTPDSDIVFLSALETLFCSCELCIVCPQSDVHYQGFTGAKGNGSITRRI